MTRSNWDQATKPKETECPRCGEDRLIDLVESPRHPVMYCNVCGHNWRVSARLTKEP